MLNFRACPRMRLAETTLDSVWSFFFYFIFQSFDLSPLYRFIKKKREKKKFLVLRKKSKKKKTRFILSECTKKSHENTQQQNEHQVKRLKYLRGKFSYAAFFGRTTGSRNNSFLIVDYFFFYHCVQGNTIQHSFFS